MEKKKKRRRNNKREAGKRIKGMGKDVHRRRKSDDTQHTATHTHTQCMHVLADTTIHGGCRRPVVLVAFASQQQLQQITKESRYTNSLQKSPHALLYLPPGGLRLSVCLLSVGPSSRHPPWNLLTNGKMREEEEGSETFEKEKIAAGLLRDHQLLKLQATHTLT